MNKQELIKKYKKLEGVWDATGAETARQIFLQDLDQLDEPQPVEVPKFVADWIETAKKATYNIRGAIEMAPKGRIEDWLELKNVDTFAEAWVNGYTVEKEKRYEVVLHNGQSLKTVYRQGDDHLDFEMVYGDLESFTRKRLEDAGFGWVFDCPGFQIEEVTE